MWRKMPVYRYEGASLVKNLPAMQKAWVQSLEKGMATHSGILAWRIPWTEEPGRLWSTGSQRVRQDWGLTLSHIWNATYFQTCVHLLTQYYCGNCLFIPSWGRIISRMLLPPLSKQLAAVTLTWLHLYVNKPALHLDTRSVFFKLSARRDLFCWNPFFSFQSATIWCFYKIQLKWISRIIMQKMENSVLFS